MALRKRNTRRKISIRKSKITKPLSKREYSMLSKTSKARLKRALR